MAFIFYKQSTAEERLLCLCYPYRPLLEDYFSPNNPNVFFTTYWHCHKTMTKSRKGFKWDDLLLDLEYDAEFQSLNEKYFQTVANALMTVLYDCDCDNMRTVLSVILMYFHAKLKLGPDYQITQRKDKILEEHKEHKEHKECFPKRAQAIYRCQILHNAYIFMSIHLADGKFLQVLLRYGLQCLASSDEYEIAEATAEKFAKWMSDEYHNNHSTILKEVQDKLESYVGDDEEFWRRKYDVIKGLEAIMRKRGQCKSLPRYVECVNLYFESVPEPFITKREVQKLILALMSGHNYIGMDETVEDLCNDFVELFPDTATEFYSPRKLQHICRCKVRKVLDSCTPFPTSIDSLVEQRHVSRAMSDYILCHMPLKYCNN